MVCYAGVGDFESVSEVFDEMLSERDRKIVSWTPLVHGHIK